MAVKPDKLDSIRTEKPAYSAEHNGSYLDIISENCLVCVDKPCIKACPYNSIAWREEGISSSLAIKEKITEENSGLEEELSQEEAERLYILGFLPKKPEEPESPGIAPPTPPPYTKEEKIEPININEKNATLTFWAPVSIIASRIKNILSFSGKRKGDLSDNRERKDLRVGPRGRNDRARVLLLVLALIIFLLTLFFLNRELVALREEAIERIEEGVYYSATDNDWQGWDGKDYELNNGVLTLKQDIYYAPYFRKRLTAEDFPWEDIVIRMTTSLERFGGTNYNLISLYTTVGDLSFIANHVGSLGIVTNPDFMPEYSEAVLGSEEHVIHFYLNTSQDEISVFVDGNLVFSEEYNLFMVSLLEVWLGAYWVGGGNAYGPPLGHEVSDFIIGDSDLLYFGYSFTQFLSDKLYNDTWLWILLIVPLLLILIYLFLFLSGLKKRKEEKGVEYINESEFY